MIRREFSFFQVFERHEVTEFLRVIEVIGVLRQYLDFPLKCLGVMRF